MRQEPFEEGGPGDLRVARGRALAGAAAPAVAFANEGISPLVLDDNYVDQTAPVYEGSNTVFYYNGEGQGRVPEKVVVNHDEHDVILRDDSKLVDGNFYYYYVEIDDRSGSEVVDPSDSTPVQYYKGKTLTALKGVSVKDSKGAFTMPVDTGDYAVVIGQWKDGQWSLRSVADTFSIVGFSLNDAVLCDNGDVTDTTFEMSPKGNAEADWTSRLSVAVGNHVLEPGADYSIDIVEKNGAANPSGDLTEGVTYQAVIEGADKYEGHKVIDFTVSRLDLSKSTIVGATLTDAYDPDFRLNGPLDYGVVSLNGVKSSDFDRAFNNAGYTYDLVSTPDGNEYSKVKGAYTYKVTADETNPYATGSKEFTVVYADYAATVNFAGCGYYDGRLDCYFVNNSLDKPTIFDISHVTVSPAVDYDVTVYDAAGNVVDMGGKTQLDQPGTYYVKVDVFHWSDQGKLTAGSDVAKVVVAYSPVIADSDVFMSYKGDNVESLASDTYDGSDLSQNMAFTVKSQNKTLTQGTDYTVTFEKQADDGTRTKVETITDAGTYIITVEGLTYTGKAEFTFVVSKAELKPVLQNAVDEISWASGKPVVTDTFLPYTGSAVDISFSFELDGKAVELPADSWGMTVRDSDGSKVSSVVNKGTYSVAFDDSGVQNYDILDTQVKVAEAKSFADVEPSDWFAGSVYQAKENGYVKGVSGTAMYMPDADILRRDVVVILARMARMDDRLNEMNEDQFNSEYGYTLDFSDVSSNAYYARALAWATKSGIVHGDAGADTFRPDDTITREEFAAMLSNYAKAMGEDISVDTDGVLSSANGAGTVSGWARDAVAWAKANGVMGNNGQSLNGQGNITRAQTAAMAVNYQRLPLAK